VRSIYLGPLLLALLLATLGARAGTFVHMRTTLGDLHVELYDQDKPVTVANFLRYVTNGVFTNMIFHRAFTNGIQIIQSGALGGPNTNGDLYGLPDYGTIPSEFGEGAFYSNTYGTLAMALAAGDPDSATSSWFINLKDNSFDLDFQNFTVFGRVIAGTNVLNQLNPAHPNRAVKIVNAGGALAQLPVRLSAGVTILFSDLIYVDVKVVRADVKLLGNGHRQISWGSISNKPNRLEVATNIPPIWAALITTNGNGGKITYTDTNNAPAMRLYRVAVDY
jgi:cyclophilin family peptidyl-prolyl cis-trans isomerase